jgi:hypothetical protein
MPHGGARLRLGESTGHTWAVLMYMKAERAQVILGRYITKIKSLKLLRGTCETGVRGGDGGKSFFSSFPSSHPGPFFERGEGGKTKERSVRPGQEEGKRRGWLCGSEAEPEGSQDLTPPRSLTKKENHQQHCTTDTNRLHHHTHMCVRACACIHVCVYVVYIYSNRRRRRRRHHHAADRLG